MPRSVEGLGLRHLRGRLLLADPLHHLALVGAARGQELVGLPESRLRPLRRKLQMVFQDPHASLNPSMTVGRALMSESPLSTSPWRCRVRARSPRTIIEVDIPAAPALVPATTMFVSATIRRSFCENCVPPRIETSRI